MKKKWAARVQEMDFDTDERVERLVVVRAESADEARRESGLVEAEFAEATAQDLAEWEQVMDEEFSIEELHRLEKMVRGKLVELANKRARRRVLGDPLGDPRGHGELDLGVAVRLCVLRGRLRAWIEDYDAEEVEAA